MNRQTDILTATLIIVVTILIGFVINIHNKVDKIYSILDPERVEFELQVTE